jgi:putative oxidoreductase
MKNLVGISGRILFSLPFLVFGVFHLMNSGAMAGMVPSYLPGGIFWVILTGLALIAAAISLYIKKMVRLAMLLLALFLVITALAIQLPGLSNPNPQMAQMALPGLLKDLGLAGAALFMAFHYWDS